MQATNINDMVDADKDKVREFLLGHPIGVLATVNAEGLPNASTIYFGTKANLEITFTTKRDTRKHQNINHSNKVMLVVYDAESQSAVQVSGEAHEVDDPASAQEIYHGTLYAAKQTAEDNVPPIAKLPAGPYVAYNIVPETVSMTEYGSGDSFQNAMEHATDPAASGDPA